MRPSFILIRSRLQLSLNLCVSALFEFELKHNLDSDGFMTTVKTSLLGKPLDRFAESPRLVTLTTRTTSRFHRPHHTRGGLGCSR